GGMVSVDPVSRCSARRSDPYGLIIAASGLSAGAMPAPSKNFPGLVATQDGDCREPRPHRTRRASLRFSNINAPIAVEGSRQIDSDPGEPTRLFACPGAGAA